jgi:hypothetical protein
MSTIYLAEMEVNKETINNYLKADIDVSALNPNRQRVCGLVKVQSPTLTGNTILYPMYFDQSLTCIDLQFGVYKLKALILWSQQKSQQYRKEGDGLKLIITQIMV